MSWSTPELRVRLAPWKRLKPPVKYFTDRSKAVLLLWIFYVLMLFPALCLLCLCARLFIIALWSPAWKGLTSWLSFVVSNSEFVTFPLVSWVRCGTWLYRFLIFPLLLTFLTFFTRISFSHFVVFAPPDYVELFVTMINYYTWSMVWEVWDLWSVCWFLRFTGLDLVFANHPNVSAILQTTTCRHHFSHTLSHYRTHILVDVC